jgi:syntaxin 16
VNSVQQITPDLEQIKKKIAQLVEQHKKHLLPGFDDRTEDERAIEILTAEITRMFQKCHERIKHIGAGEALTAQELLVRPNIQSTLAQQLQALSLEFRRHQKEYLQRLRGRQERGARFSLSTTGLEGEGDNDDDDADFFIDKGFTPDQLQTLRQNSQEITQREREIRQIVKSIRELAELFNDMALLVKEQGTIVDRIDYTIEQTSAQTKRGVEELSKAADYQKKSTSRWCMGLIMLLILGVIVFIIIKVV